MARDPASAMAVLLVVSLLFGGGGVMAALTNLAVVLTALIVLGLHGTAVVRFIKAGPLGLRLLAFATVAVPLVQLVPLPPGMWQGLPGRDLVSTSLDLVGGAGWFPLSLDPGRTLLAAVGLVAPFAILTVGFALPPDRLAALQRVVIALGVGSALFGSLNLVNDGWGDPYRWQRPMPGILTGTFADRNAGALFFCGCLLLIAGLPRWPKEVWWRAAAVGAAAFLVLAVFLTGSRSGMALLVLPLTLAIWRLASTMRAAPRARALALGLFCLVLAVGAAIAAAGAPGRLSTSLERFGETDGMRTEMREDALFAASHYWPVGAGMGTFDEVFQVDESLEYISPRRAGHAHMDYYELAIEAGLGGLAALACWLAWFAWHSWRALRRPGAWSGRAAAFFLASIAAQSLLSFPLRNQAMLCAAAFTVVLLARSPVARAARPDGPR